MYSQLFSIKVTHDYFMPELCRSVTIEPLAATTKLMEAAGLRCKKLNAGIAVLHDSAQHEALEMHVEQAQLDSIELAGWRLRTVAMLEEKGDVATFDELQQLQQLKDIISGELWSAPQGLNLLFMMRCSDTAFRSYSEPFSRDVDEILYLHNNQTHSLHAGESASNMNLRKPRWFESMEAFGRRDRLLSPLAIININIANGEALAHLLSGSSLPSGDADSFTIKFGAKKTYWKYYILGKSKNDKLSVVGHSADVQFSAFEEVALANNAKAMASVSKDRIPLHLRPELDFQLVSGAEGSERVIVERLPVASVMQTGMEVIGDEEVVVSEMYVNC